MNRADREDYVHGYSGRESARLRDQADTLTELLHGDTGYPDGSRVLEAGCGVGAQTVTLAAKSPGADITSVDLSRESLAEAARTVGERGLANVTFRQADIFDLPFPDGSFDHLFLCFVLEHLSDPMAALAALKRVLRPGGTITVIEGDHGSACFHPDSPFARRAIRCLVDLQARGGGNALIGRALSPLLARAGFSDIAVSPRVVYADAGRPWMVEGFTKKTFTAMVEGVREEALAAGMMSEQDWDRGVADLYRTAGGDGTFSYTFFKAVAVKKEKSGGV
jgi:SAM-dependent methyltransferase